MYNHQVIVKSENIKQLKAVGSNLRKARLSVDLTQEELARKVDITTNYYARLERGETLPSLTTLYKIAQATKTTMARILTF